MSYLAKSVERWNEMFEILVQYKQKYGEQVQEGGQMAVDKEDVSASFSFWLDTQTDFWNHHKVGSHDILDERYHRLATLGGLGGIETVAKKSIISQEERWNDMYESLIGFKKKHGHVKVPEKCNENPKLGIWVRSWRSKYREYKRTNGQKGDPKRMKRLESIGVVDDLSTGNEQRRYNSSWDKMVILLLEFRQKHGHLKVPHTCNENLKLGRWVARWRSKYRKYKRSNGKKGNPVQMRRLESIGMVDDISTGYEHRGTNSSWDEMCKQLVEFKQKHGHLKVPEHCDESRKLANQSSYWRSEYREYKRKNGQKGDPQRMKQLESIGLVDDISTGYETRCTKSKWDDMFTLLIDFKQKHGHLKVPSKFDKDPKLGRWVGYWRSNYRKYTRTNGQKGDPEKMERLESIGVVDDIIFKEKEDKKTKCADNKVVAPIIVSSMPLTFSSNTQIITKETPSLTGVKEKENGDSDSANTTQADLAFLGSELRGGFWA